MRVGVTGANQKDYLAYARALRDAAEFNGIAIGVESLENRLSAIARDVARLDGVLFSGGTDVDPSLYGAQPHQRTKRGDVERDAYEIALMRAARDARLPTLAICRGMQLANVAFGGGLLQHLPDLVNEQIVHDRYRDTSLRPDVVPSHIVTPFEDSLLASLVGSEPFATSARHHQAIDNDRVAADLVVVAETADGVIEAVEATFISPFWLGVQWHPETTLDDGGQSRAIFTAFLRACVNRSASITPVNS